jgi:hypothetical protein
LFDVDAVDEVSEAGRPQYEKQRLLREVRRKYAVEHLSIAFIESGERMERER